MKRITSILIAIMAVNLVWCGGAKEASPTVYAEFIDHAGRSVTLAEKAEKIVSGYYITSSMVIGLGLEDNVVGIENKADTRSIYRLAAPQLLEVPGVGTAKNFDLELCLELQPDFVILPLKLKDAANSLAEFGIPTICVNPENDVLLEETIRMIAKATGTTKRAEKILATSNEKIETLQKKLQENDTPTVYFAGNSDILNTAGSKMYQNTLITEAGGENVAKEIDDTYWASISYEQLIQYNPEYIIIAPAAKYGVEDVLSNTTLSSLDAIKNKHVYKMPSSLESWDSPLPSSFLGTLWLSSVIHPEDYSEDDFIEETVDFYKTFYDISVDTAKL